MEHVTKSLRVFFVCIPVRVYETGHHAMTLQVNFYVLYPLEIFRQSILIRKQDKRCTLTYLSLSQFLIVALTEDSDRGTLPTSRSTPIVDVFF